MQSEISRRRTFAIISHPDAGKTTLTEKLLLYGGAVQLAGSVTARKNQRAATSDWMELERKRGISISSTVLQFDYDGYRINLLDTPGHKDFSEDTYRVLTAVDAVVMVIDAGKGIETQTRKLFEVCRRRGVPIFTFMNKCDRPTREPLALLDELESVLGIGAFPVNWPLGTGPDFRGVFDRQTRAVHLFERTVGGAYRAPVTIADLARSLRPRKTRRVRLPPQSSRNSTCSKSPAGILRAGRSSRAHRRRSSSAAPSTTSASNCCSTVSSSIPPRRPPHRAGDRLIQPDDPVFSGFIFKIQANMDPRHRDRIAFVRVCSGKFERDMTVTHAHRKKVRLSSSHKLFGHERETVDEAYPGDIIGLVGHSDFGIGDTLTAGPHHRLPRDPALPARVLRLPAQPEPGKFKQFRTGLDQLLQEGVIQVFHLRDAGQRVPLLAAVGPLQFEVVQYRLEAEYGAPSRLDAAPWEMLKWVRHGMTPEELDALKLPTGCRVAEDSALQPVILFPTNWTFDYFRKQNPEVELFDLSADSRPIESGE